MVALAFLPEYRYKAIYTKILKVAPHEVKPNDTGAQRRVAIRVTGLIFTADQSRLPGDGGHLLTSLLII